MTDDKMPEGWKRLERNQNYLELNFGSMSETYQGMAKALEMLREMAEALEIARSFMGCDDYSADEYANAVEPVDEVLKKFREWK